MGKQILIAVTSNGKRTGTLTPEQFMKGSGAPKSAFLPDAIKQFNAWKAKNGEPERAEQILESALSFKEKRTLQASLTANTAKLRGGSLSFKDKRALQGENAGILAQLRGTQAPTPPPPAVNTLADGTKALDSIKGFLPRAEFMTIKTNMLGEEGQYFIDMAVSLAKRIETMPKVYGQDGLGDKAIVYLHYFKGGSDWYITEKDSEPEQLQAFGYAILNGDRQNAEMGYISIVELTGLGVELDLYYTPEPLGAVKGKDDSGTDTPDETQPDDTTPGNPLLEELLSGKYNTLDVSAFLAKVQEYTTAANDVKQVIPACISYIDANKSKISAVMESAIREAFGRLWREGMITETARVSFQDEKNATKMLNANGYYQSNSPADNDTDMLIGFRHKGVQMTRNDYKKLPKNILDAMKIVVRESMQDYEDSNYDEKTGKYTDFYTASPLKLPADLASIFEGAGTTCQWCGANVTGARCKKCGKAPEQGKADRRRYEEKHGTIGRNEYPAEIGVMEGAFSRGSRVRLATGITGTVDRRDGGRVFVMESAGKYAWHDEKSVQLAA